MSEITSLPVFGPEYLPYGDAVVYSAAEDLRTEINDLAMSPDSSIAEETKVDGVGFESPVTKYDKNTERRIYRAYVDTSVRIQGEEKMSEWPVEKTPKLDLHLDPIDGTALFIAYVRELIAWEKLPEANRPLRPICASMVSAGAVRPGSVSPEWAVIAAPFMSHDGIVRWNVGPHKPALRIEPDGRKKLLPHASSLSIPEQGGVVLVSSDTAEEQFTAPLEDEGYRVLKLKSAVAAALCSMDPGLFEYIRPNELQGDPIVGVALRSAENWDVAGVIAIAQDRGHFVSKTDGSPRTFEDGTKSAIIAVRETIGRTIVRAIAPVI